MKYDIDQQINDYINNNELANAVLIVRKNNEEVYHKCFGYTDLKTKEKVDDHSIFRTMSMSKPVIAVAIMKLIEENKLKLDDPIEKYIPEFKDMKVVRDNEYKFTMNPLKILRYLITFDMNKVKCKDRRYSITVRDLLTHSSGLQQGMVGLLDLAKTKNEKDRSLKENIRRYSKLVLDFEPGTSTNYSPLAGFNVLGYLIEVISNMSLQDYLSKNIFIPLEMNDTSFFLDNKDDLVRLYKRKKNDLIDVTDSKDDMYAVMHMEKAAYEAGAGGLFSTANDYEHLAWMLLNKGMYKEKRILSEESVTLMFNEGALRHLEPEAGMVWGLGVKIRQNPELAKSFATQGTYGWSGAFGTHFFVSPFDNLEAVFMTNRADLNGAGSYVSNKIEEMVFGNWSEKC